MSGAWNFWKTSRKFTHQFSNEQIALIFFCNCKLKWINQVIMIRNITNFNITRSLIKSLQRNITTTSQLNEIFKVQDEKDFEERVLKSKRVVIVDFMALWCGPCKLLTPRIESVINENKDKVSLAKVWLIKNYISSRSSDCCLLTCVFLFISLSSEGWYRWTYRLIAWARCSSCSCLGSF